MKDSRSDGNHPSKESPDVKFDEFVRYVVDGHWEPHWSTFQSQCCPCRIQYDAIGTMQTFYDDSSHILQRFFNQTPTDIANLLERLNVNENGQTTLRDTKKFLDQLDDPLKQSVAYHFSDDYQMFGFNSSQTLGISVL
jgi:hypothetical protein